jgi:hypothetical protein
MNRITGSKFELFLTMALDHIPGVTYNWEGSPKVLNVTVQTVYDPLTHPDYLDKAMQLTAEGKLDEYIELLNKYPKGIHPERKGSIVLERVDIDIYSVPFILFFGHTEVARQLASKICNYFNSEKFRTYLPRLPLLEIDTSMDVFYDHTNPIHRYLFDHVMIREICSYIRPLPEMHIEYRMAPGVHICVPDELLYYK